jgi:5-methylcytosine-specific restriction endonuclease McrA
VRRTRDLERRRVIERRAGNRCEYCRAPQPASGVRYHLEHIVPRALGGSDDLENLALACPTCNYYKASDIEGFDKETLTDARIFNPRIDDWSEHFDFHRDSLELTGKTPIARVTIEQLRLNQHMHIEARAHWVQLDLYP